MGPPAEMRTNEMRRGAFSSPSFFSLIPYSAYAAPLEDGNSAAGAS